MVPNLRILSKALGLHGRLKESKEDNGKRHVGVRREKKGLLGFVFWHRLCWAKNRKGVLFAVAQQKFAEFSGRQ
jgi:hypothetical protein